MGTFCIGVLSFLAGWLLGCAFTRIFWMNERKRWEERFQNERDSWEQRLQAERDSFESHRQKWHRG